MAAQPAMLPWSRVEWGSAALLAQKTFLWMRFKECCASETPYIMKGTGYRLTHRRGVSLRASCRCVHQKKSIWHWTQSLNGQVISTTSMCERMRTPRRMPELRAHWEHAESDFAGPSICSLHRTAYRL